MNQRFVFFQLVAVFACFGVVNPCHGDLITDFNGIDTGGWMLENPGILTGVPDAAATGIAGIEFNDQSNGTNRYISPWTGDLSGQIGQSLRYGLVFVRPSGTANWTSFDMDVLISDGTTTLSVDLDYDITQPPLATVLNQDVTLDAATFGTDTATFASVMANVETLKIRAEHWDSNGVEGYLTQVVPEPVSCAWLGGLGTLISLRRRSRH